MTQRVCAKYTFKDWQLKWYGLTIIRSETCVILASYLYNACIGECGSRLSDWFYVLLALTVTHVKVCKSVCQMYVYAEDWSIAVIYSEIEIIYKKNVSNTDKLLNVLILLMEIIEVWIACTRATFSKQCKHCGRHYMICLTLSVIFYVLYRYFGMPLFLKILDKQV